MVEHLLTYVNVCVCAIFAPSSSFLYSADIQGMHHDLALDRKIEDRKSENRILRLWGRRLCLFGLDKAGCKRTMGFVFQRIVH